MRKYEKQGLQAIVDGKRYAFVLSDSEEVRQFVAENSLGILAFSVHNPPQIVVFIPKKIHDLFTLDEITTLGFPEYWEIEKSLYTSIKELVVGEAFLFLDKKFVGDDYKSPAIDIIYGFLFGYKPCDIRYYIQTRCQGLPVHNFEKAIDLKIGDKEATIEEQHVMCEACALEYLNK